MIGGSGLLGRELVRLLGPSATGTFLRSAGVAGHRLDIRDRSAVCAVVDRLRPAVIVNAAFQQSDWATTADGAVHIIGKGLSLHERRVHAGGVLFTDDVRCPVHVSDLASAVLELADSSYAGVHHVAGPDAVSRHELGVLIARRDGLDETTLPTGLRSGLPGPLAVRLDCRLTQSRLRGAYEFLAA